MKKERVDILAFQQGLFTTREQAKRGIMAGTVYTQKNQRLDKPGEKIPQDTILKIIGAQLPYVSRGGLKLERALMVFDFQVKDKILLDIGASTGGFTDCALQNGALLSYALDVGYNQLAWKIRQDPRVIVMERTNFRYCKPADFTQGKPEVATIDVSFISLKKILPTLHPILTDQGEVMALIKPQFEAGKESVGKKGIIHDPAIHQAVLEDISAFALQENYDLQALNYSPVTGGHGNIEFIAHLKKSEQLGMNRSDIKIEQLVAKAHEKLDK
ncbi:TlyA family RNA methyltransferase [Tetragenococcus koreensis]|uniref:Cell division protein FtsJ n=1 Tax=Tetragenococcus koreensis TaxID=290335 RepID=A0AAN4UCB2_9ENTE|nr:TlyA family RNA methyltransferase [Tetragenococcus koreensis]AYW44517.1 TlyA family rRNA (cytidine-2'-O)-methyltransferase [Tetragenococcus koreensis]MCF1584241.1 TlyA family RNA methyltransferase [Tetragenococcus koreensis]MCF1613825.1 TlyA family RNA methyltransferase [Tetragenococcus koreensis]MCF1616602.1 TlyA family RNA methyltransferase [Tetragenococcus koreensis]MCF1619535.1 TlyA family RNA methyltransferase [Tetragenococcus koreensis]